MTRQAPPLRGADRPLIVGLLVVALLLLAALVWVNTQPPFAAVSGDSTISECRLGEDPSTTLCYRAAEPT